MVSSVKGTRSADLAVLVNGFPRLSETFVLQELLDLERRGLKIALFALLDPGEVVQQDELGWLRATVEYIPPSTELKRSRAMFAHAAVAAGRMQSYLGARARLLTSPEATKGALRRAAVLAWELRRLGSPPLYIHFAHKPGTIGRLAAHLAGVPYALSCHAKDIWSTAPAELRRKVSDARVVMTCTHAGQAELARLAGGSTPVLLAHHGVDVDAVAPKLVPPGPPRILSVGRLVEKKGHDVVIRSAAVLRDRDLQFTLRIAGDGVEWPRLQRLVHELDLAGHVTFLGPLSPVELSAEWGSASIFALGCRQLPNGDQDGLPNVVLEAMVQGLPVVATNLPGIAEAVQHGHTGLLVPPEDPPALAQALERVLVEPRLASELGDGGRASVCEHFDRRLLLPAVSAALAQAGLIELPAESSRSRPKLSSVAVATG